MKKLIITGLLVVFVTGCTAPEIQEADEYGTKKSESVTSESDGSEYELEDELDNSED